MHDNQIDTYIYYLNYTDQLKSLCDLEMRHILGFTPESKTFITKTYIDPNRSIFIKSCLAISHGGERIEDLVESIKEDALFYNDYKIKFIKSEENDLSYEERLEAIRDIGYAIEGEFALKEQAITFALTKHEGQWVFGEYIKNSHSWTFRKHKPFNYSYALDHMMAKTLVNIAVGNDLELKVVDPCCGIGTVVIEGRELGIDIKGFDVNPQVVEKCNKNLKYFGFKDDVMQMDIADLTDYFDVAIVDLPYGKFSKTTLSEQTEIIRKTKEIAKKAVFISMVNMDELFKASGFTIIEHCLIPKRDKFSRYITICS